MSHHQMLKVAVDLVYCEMRDGLKFKCESAKACVSMPCSIRSMR